MSKSFKELASDPLQYDRGQVMWSEEGHKLSPIRRLFLERLLPYIDSVAGKHVLDIGCGQGWLVDEIDKRGGIVTGIDPSTTNINAAVKQYPDLKFLQADLMSLEMSEQFDLITVIMAFEHLPNLKASYDKIKSLLKAKGLLLTIIGDFDRLTHPRHTYTVETEILAPGEAAIRTDYGERAGVIYDISRTVEHFTTIAQEEGFNLQVHESISAPDWLIAEQPGYAVHKGSPLFHLLEFVYNPEAL